MSGIPQLLHNSRHLWQLDIVNVAKFIGIHGAARCGVGELFISDEAKPKLH